MCGLAPGASGGRRVRLARDADILVLVISKDSIRSEWVFKEICEFYRHARGDHSRRFYPVRIDATSIQNFSLIDAHSGHDIGELLRAFSIRDFSDWRNPVKFAAAFGEMAHDLRLDAAGTAPGDGNGEAKKPEAPRLTDGGTPRSNADTASAETTAAAQGTAAKHLRVFISYSQQDTALAEMIDKRLCARGCLVSFTPFDNRLGKADACILLLSAHAIKDQVVRDEILRFYHRTLADSARRFHVIRVDDVPLQDFSLIDPESERDVGQILCSLFLRDFTHWRDQGQFLMAFDALARDLGVGSASIAPGVGRLADHPDRSQFMTAGQETDIVEARASVGGAPESSRDDLLFELAQTVRSKDKDGMSVEWFKSQERILEKLGEDGVLKVTVANRKMFQGDELACKGQLDAALALYREAEKLYRDCQNSEGLKFCLESQVTTLRAMRAKQ